MRKRIIVACDVSDKESYLSLLKRVSPHIGFIKVGMELFYSLGVDSIKIARDFDLEVFVDLKLHDIPNTVYKACKTLARQDIAMTNIHAAGAIDMMKAAREAINEINPNIKLIGVTQLTSTTQRVMNDEILIPRSIDQAVLEYAQNCYRARLDGIVCSAHEVRTIKSYIHNSFLCVTPGIRLKEDSPGDQKRIMTPKEAICEGADYLVIGRSITQSLNIEKTVSDILKEIDFE